MKNKIIYLFEDDYCMIELLPLANFNFCKEQAIKANEYSIENKAASGYGWTNCFALKEAPISLVECKINVIEFEKKLSHIMKKATVCIMGTNEICESVNGFAIGRFQLFYEYDNDLLTKIWLNFIIGDDIEKDNAFNILHALGTEYDIILNDNYESITVPLSDKQALKDYLRLLLQS